MFKRLSHQLGKSKQNTRKLWEKEFNIVNDGLDEKQVIAFVDSLITQRKASRQAAAASLHSFLQRIITDAEQIAASIKTKAQTEAEDEAGRIISQARQEAEEIKRKAEIVVQKEAEDILSEANRKVEITEVEAKQQAPLSSPGAEEEVEKEIREEQPVQLQEETAVSEPVEVTAGELLEQDIQEERPVGETTGPAPPKQDSQTHYTGEVELAISAPVDLKMVSKLYNYLQTIPDIKILHTSGTWDRGTTITVVLDKPIPLISIISKIGGIEAIPELPEKDSAGKEKLSSLLGKKKGGAKRIRLATK